MGARKGGAVEALTPMDFEIWHFHITFLAKKGCFLFREGKMKFHHSTLRKSCWLHLEKSNIGLPGKNPSDDHGYGPVGAYDYGMFRIFNANVRFKCTGVQNLIVFVIGNVRRSIGWYIWSQMRSSWIRSGGDWNWKKGQSCSQFPRHRVQWNKESVRFFVLAQLVRLYRPGLPDENFNKKPNSAKKGQKKAKPIV